MDFGCGGSAGSSGGDENGEGASGSGGIRPKCDDFETTMKAMKDAVVKECEEKSAKIRKLMEENVGLKQDNGRLGEPVVLFENLPFGEPGVDRPLVARSDPFDVFPPEVWEVIIEKITGYSELEAFCLAFPQLEQMVKERKKTIFLFEKVIPLISKKFDLKDILNCRLACHKWNQDLCALLDNSYASSDSDLTSSIPPVFYHYQYGRPSLKYFNAYRFENARTIRRFMEKMSDHPGNPFFGRFLRLFDEYSDLDSEYFWKSAFQLVGKFGEHIWSVEIYQEYCYNRVAFYKALQQLILYLPNLRYLHVKCFIDGKDPSEENMNLTGTQFWNSPLSPLPYLQSLKLGLNGDTRMINAFTPHFSNQIHRLDLLKEALGNGYLKAESLRGLVNLQYLVVKLASKQDILRLLEFPTGNLKKLTLYSYFPVSQDLDSFNLEQVASLSEKFSRLEHLDLSWCSNELSSFLGSRIRFTGLKTLEIGVGIGDDDIQHNLDFILQLSSLKHLVIEIQFVGRTDREEYDRNSELKIRQYLDEGHLLQSNIWTLMPSLEFLETRGNFRAFGGMDRNGIFTREMFENRVG